MVGPSGCDIWGSMLDTFISGTTLDLDSRDFCQCFSPHEVTVSAAISACGTCSEWCWALALLQELCERHPQVAERGQNQQLL